MPRPRRSYGNRLPTLEARRDTQTRRTNGKRWSVIHVPRRFPVKSISRALDTVYLNAIGRDAPGLETAPRIPIRASPREGLAARRACAPESISPARLPMNNRVRSPVSLPRAVEVAEVGSDPIPHPGDDE